MNLTVEEFHEHTEAFNGFCKKCNDITRLGGTEPDARNYPCAECGTNSAMGVEEALMMGFIEIEILE